MLRPPGLDRCNMRFRLNTNHLEYLYICLAQFSVLLWCFMMKRFSHVRERMCSLDPRCGYSLPRDKGSTRQSCIAGTARSSRDSTVCPSEYFRFFTDTRRFQLPSIFEIDVIGVVKGILRKDSFITKPVARPIGEIDATAPREGSLL